MPTMMTTPNGNRRRMHGTRHRNYQKVLLGVYLTADAEGLVSVATHKEIAEASGLSAVTIPSYLTELERDGHIAILKPGEYDIPSRRIVLLDHPDARSNLKRFDKVYRNTRAWRS